MKDHEIVMEFARSFARSEAIIVVFSRCQVPVFARPACGPGRSFLEGKIGGVRANRNLEDDGCAGDGGKAGIPPSKAQWT